MKKKIIKLNNLKVQSFITKVEDEKVQTAKGGRSEVSVDYCTIDLVHTKQFTCEGGTIIVFPTHANCTEVRTGC